MATAIKALVVGTGFGCRIQVPALRGAGFNVVGLVGTDPTRMAERAGSAGVIGAYVDLATAVRQTGAHLVAISTPPLTHADLTLQAIALGCHVLCEKPFARDAAEAQRMLDAAQSAGVIHALGNEFRFVPERAMLGRVIAKGMIGEPRFASLVQLSGFVTEFENDFPDWWYDPCAAGGWLGASGSHAIDQIRSWLGEFSSLSASLSHVAITRSGVEDSFAMRFRLAGGLEGVLQQSSAAMGGMTEIIRIAGSEGSVWIDQGAVHFADRSGERVLPIDDDLILNAPPAVGDDPRQQRLDWQIMAAVEIAPYTELCKSVRAAILGNKAPSPVPLATFRDGVANMAVMDAIRASAQRGGELIALAP